MACWFCCFVVLMSVVCGFEFYTCWVGLGFGGFFLLGWYLRCGLFVSLVGWTYDLWFWVSWVLVVLVGLV